MVSTCKEGESRSKVHHLSSPISSHLESDFWSILGLWVLGDLGRRLVHGAILLGVKWQFALVLPCVYAHLVRLPGVSMVKPTKLQSCSSVQWLLILLPKHFLSVFDGGSVWVEEGQSPCRVTPAWFSKHKWSSHQVWLEWADWSFLAVLIRTWG